MLFSGTCSFNRYSSSSWVQGSILYPHLHPRFFSGLYSLLFTSLPTETSLQPWLKFLELSDSSLASSHSRSLSSISQNYIPELIFIETSSLQSILDSIIAICKCSQDEDERKRRTQGNGLLAPAKQCKVVLMSMLSKLPPGIKNLTKTIRGCP